MDNLLLEEVVWEDHYDISRWMDIEEVEENGQTPLLVYSSGYVVSETKRYIALANHVRFTDRGLLVVDGVMYILKATIKRRTKYGKSHSYK